MSSKVFVPIVLAMPSMISESRSAGAAWSALQKRVLALGSISQDILAVDINVEVEAVAKQLESILARTPPPRLLKLLYFGLFAAVNPATFEEEAGYYLAGSTENVPRVNAASDLADGILDYSPDEPYLESRLLGRIKKAALADGTAYARYDYALMLGAAAVVSAFAVRRLGLNWRVVVGFDSGDAVDLASQPLLRHV